jgi:hypothetical protein
LLLAELPGEVTIAWKALARRGPAWTGAVAASLARLDPEIVSGLKGLGIAPRATRA